MLFVRVKGDEIVAPHDGTARSWTIETVYMAVFERDGDEVVFSIAAGPDGQMVPYSALNQRQLALLRRYSQELANENRTPVRIISFTTRKLCDTVEPSTTGD
jgi:hypothetical protein